MINGETTRMTRRIAASQERIMFPAWNIAGSPEEDEEQSRRPYRRRRMSTSRCVSQVTLLLVVMTGAGIVYHRFQIGSDAALGADLSQADLHALNMSKLQPVPMSQDNPWRGAGRRLRHDVIRSVPGCGGTFRRAVAHGDQVQVRYAMWRDDRIIDSSSSSVNVIAGSSQIPRKLDSALTGLCAGEAVRVRVAETETLLLVEKVGKLTENEREEELDSLARSITALPARRGHDCRSECARQGMQCAQHALALVNNCPRLREAFGCEQCETAAVGSAGADMPAFVVRSAPRGHARGACLVSPRVDMSRCEARYAHTRRLCSCVPA
ncbi:FKBP-type peptidyl-prolyl cis-trans isomerase [Gracilaria domingensis]|nr:FKBP-type peptidyl-prolyl cis-trans isomerase [Gracilaria domingensis]